ncbi:hypothetical protein M446_0902 [Methylobacterium sp. 4-46]|nr:hypothetical protein M446_0902 [Methylobacterium sp. 4-46]
MNRIAPDTLVHWSEVAALALLVLALAVAEVI